MKLQTAIVMMLATVGVSSPVLGQVKIDPTWLTWDAGTSTATFKLIAGLQGGKSPTSMATPTTNSRSSSRKTRRS